MTKMLIGEMQELIPMFNLPCAGIRYKEMVEMQNLIRLITSDRIKYWGYEIDYGLLFSCPPPVFYRAEAEFPFKCGGKMRRVLIAGPVADFGNGEGAARQ